MGADDQAAGGESVRTVVDTDNLQIRAESRTEVTIAFASGRIDGANASEALSALESIIDGDVPVLLLDFENLTYISSAGLRVLLQMARQLQQRSAVFGVCSLSQDVGEVIRVSGFDAFITVYSDLPAALSSIGQ
jgi:anti-anti-sigma factor